MDLYYISDGRNCRKSQRDLDTSYTLYICHKYTVLVTTEWLIEYLPDQYTCEYHLGNQYV